MFCFQCEQTAKGQGCDKMGVCGKEPEVADLQDLLRLMATGVAQYAHRAAVLHKRDTTIDRYVIEALFTTVTNVSFDPARVEAKLREGVAVRARAKTLYEEAARAAGAEPERLAGPAIFEPAPDREGLLAQEAAASIAERRKRLGEDVAGLQETIVYGLKGAAAYMDHAAILGQDDPSVYAEFHRILSWLADEPADIQELLKVALETGALNLKVMELLDAANTGAYGHPEPTQARITPKAGKCILVSGHDLKDLEALLQQTEGKGINIYTHGEMLPALAYPGLKKYPHLVGNYGGAWQDQAKEFDLFPGAVLMTTNCIQRPQPTYQDRIFTCGLVSWPGVAHITDRDFAPVIAAALAAPGFAEDGPDKSIPIGFARNTVMSVAETVVGAVKGGAIKHFFLVGGCDGAKPGRNYYTEFVEQVPQDCVVLTLACGKFRFNKLEMGEIGGIPRLLDVGQCNDAYSAVQIAVALADAFDCGVNDLPLSLVLSWYEQKAVAILLTLLHLGIKNIRLGPSLPAFITPAALQVLVDTFQIAPVTTPAEDLKAILG